jgi:L-ribulose-5-phosphate 4-epimerase
MWNIVILLQTKHLNMTESEGVIKYQLHHTDEELPKDCSLAELNAWRTVLFQLNLIGQDPARYQGLGYGNISQRLADSSQFVISGTQTGQLETLSKHDYCLITEAYPNKNQIYAQGQCKPSSEALTHASVYQHDKNIHAVIHVHSPVIWQNTNKLNLAHTAANIAYGTPEMAEAVADLLATKPAINVFTMLGHEDGVIAFGESLNVAATVLIQLLAAAFTLAQFLC